MKIAFWHFYTFRLLRGIETLVVSLANAMARKGIDVSIITSKPTTQPLVAPDPRVKLFAFPVPRYYSHDSIVPFYVCHFLRHRYDDVAVFFADFGEGRTWRLLHRIREIPLTLYLCYSYSAAPHRYRSFLRLGWEREARHILADGTWFAKEAEALFQRPVGVVPVGTDPTRFLPDRALRNRFRAQWGFGESQVVLLNVSALEREKGTWRVIESMGRLQDQFPNLRYFILGRGEAEADLQRLVKERGLSDRVIFGGVTSELEAYYNMADVFVMLPDAEANSIACHEAMSSELPVVVADTEGFRESVPPNAGFRVGPDEPAQIDAALIQLIRDPRLCRELGQAGRRHILANYTWDRIADRYLELVK